MHEPVPQPVTNDVALAELARALQEVAGISPELTGSLDLRRDLALDSLSLLGVVTLLEDRFRIIFREEDAPSLQTVADVTAYIVRQIEESSC